ncbi:MAG: diaminopropionate ammonia-lyase [Bacillota bacterium]|nr:diaminopropionate ammonia-lyase [Bacillota bacterium]
MNEIRWIRNGMAPSGDAYTSLMGQEEVEKARAFHRSFPQYRETPLAELPAMAAYLGIGRLFIKDESWRFGLNAFKALGGSYAMGRYLGELTGRDPASMDYRTVTSEALRKETGEITFFTATDGNHGRGVAWAARELGQKAVVYMPRGTTGIRLENILREGARATIEEASYEECVRMAAEAAAASGGVVVQDTAWEGYEKIPSWIMQGYGTMIAEADEQMEKAASGPPTHVFIQAGVGSVTGAVAGYFALKYPQSPPVLITIEAEAADCLYQSALAGDGKPRRAAGSGETIMAGLNCGEANIISWDILRNHCSFFTAISDQVAVKGMRMAAAPLKGDPQVISGESGAVGLGLLAALMETEEWKELREAAGLDSASRVLLFSTEGDTDPERYRNIVWRGLER